MKILIIDNDKIIREGLVTLLKSIINKNDLVEEANGVTDGLSKISLYQPDLVFLDVEMDDGTGFDLISKLGSYNFQLIFITAYNKYAVDAFRFSAIDFLEKPIDSVELVASIDKAKKGIQNNFLQQQIEILQTVVSAQKTSDQKIVLKDQESIHFVKISDIIRCEADGAYTKFVLQNGSPLLLSKNLKEYDELLANHGFIRCHHAHLVNQNKIIRFDKLDGGALILENNESIPVSQRKKDYVLTRLANG